MPRIRQIKPEFWSSLSIGALDRLTRLHFIALWNYVDDDGRGIDDPRLLKAQCFPLDDDLTTAEIDDYQAQLERHGRIVRYEVAGRRYFSVVNFAEHQYVQKKVASKLPPPPTEPTKAPVSVRAPDNDEHPPEPLPEDSGSPTEPEPEDYRLYWGKGKGKGKGLERCDPTLDNDGNAPADTTSPPHGGSPPINLDDFDEFWSAYPQRNGKRVGRKQAEAQWRRLSAPQRRAALVGVAHYAAHCARTDQFAKDAHRWLRDCAFDDWQQPPAPAPPTSTRGAPRSIRGRLEHLRFADGDLGAPPPTAVVIDVTERLSS